MYYYYYYSTVNLILSCNRYLRLIVHARATRRGLQSLSEITTSASAAADDGVPVLVLLEHSEKGLVWNLLRGTAFERGVPLIRLRISFWTRTRRVRPPYPGVQVARVSTAPVQSTAASSEAQWWIPSYLPCSVCWSAEDWWVPYGCASRSRYPGRGVTTAFGFGYTLSVAVSTRVETFTFFDKVFVNPLLPTCWRTSTSSQRSTRPVCDRRELFIFTLI